jgi:peptide-methionine (S)-S-oxide reductase
MKITSLILVAAVTSFLGYWGMETYTADSHWTVDELLSDPEDKKNKTGAKKLETATLGAGCFWCVEAVFKELKGVKTVESGYSNGKIPNPTYQQVCTGLTGHAEVIRVRFEPAVISFGELLEVFWKTHDPTTLNRQGADRGTQYRSGIYYHSNDQKKIATELKQKLDAAKIWRNPIVTEIVKAETFYKAEDYHQDYFSLNGQQPYCRAVIVPKMEKFRRVFKDKLKTQ